METRPVYMDNHSTTMVDPIVLDSMLPYFCEKYGNAASVSHSLGWEAGDAVETARCQVAEVIDSEAKSIVFTSGATEANNIALCGVMRAAGSGKHLIVNAAEHKAVLDPAFALRKEGFDVTVLPVDQYGRVDPQTVVDAIQENTVLVSVMFANNEVGTINAVEKIGKICRDRGVLFHTDATQVVGKLKIAIRSLSIDLLSFSAHKMYGPKGIGALYVRPGSPRVRIEPIMYGGGHERRMRSGTLAVPLIVGFGAACDLANRLMADEGSRVANLRNRFVESVTSQIDGVVINGHATERLSGNTHLSITGVNSEALLMQLKNVVCLSTGSACTTANPEPSHVLQAMGIPDEQIESSIRVGLGRFNTDDEVTVVVEALEHAVRELRRLTSAPR